MFCMRRAHSPFYFNYPRVITASHPCNAPFHRRCTLPHPPVLLKISAEVPAISASHAEVEALRVDNMQLRQRLEEMQALLDTQAAAGAETARSISSFAGSTSRTRIPLSARTLAKEVQSADQHRPRKSRSHGCSALDEAAAVDSMATATAAASEAILRGQVAQLRRQVRLQWTAVDASSAVTQEVRGDSEWSCSGDGFFLARKARYCALFHRLLI